MESIGTKIFAGAAKFLSKITKNSDDDYDLNPDSRLNYQFLVYYINCIIKNGLIYV